MIAGQEWKFESTRLAEPAETVFASADMRITGRGVFTTPLSFQSHIASHSFSYLQVVVDKHNRFFLYFRSDWPADRYYGPYEIVLNRRAARVFSDMQLTHFSYYADGTGRLDVRCVPGIVGGVFYSLSGISPADGQMITGLVEKGKEPQSQWRDWF